MNSTERNYQFRQRIDRVHHTGRRDPSATPSPGETAVNGQWCIVCPADADDRIVNAAKDLQDYFLVSQRLSLPIVPERPAAAPFIELAIDPALTGVRTFRLTAAADRITIAGADAKGVISGCFHCEDLMNLREAPFLTVGSVERKPLIGLRMVHSGWGIDCFPSEHLNAVAHAGFTAVVIFITGIDRTNVGPLDVNDVIDRAELYGLDVMLYAYLPGFKHPDEADAPEFFENVYTKLFQHYPKALGVMLVGESAEFPSRDERTTGKRFQDSAQDGIPDTRPSPGWFPCRDYPAWLRRVTDAVHKAKPDAMVVFNTYNWYWAEEELRREFLRSIPRDVTVQITFDIGREINREGVLCQVRDYSISADRPGDYFRSEAAVAHEMGLNILATANTAGATWDFGVIPYVPVPQQWLRRFRALEQARREG